MVELLSSIAYKYTNIQTFAAFLLTSVSKKKKKYTAKVKARSKEIQHKAAAQVQVQVPKKQ